MLPRLLRPKSLDSCTRQSRGIAERGRWGAGKGNRAGADFARPRVRLVHGDREGSLKKLRTAVHSYRPQVQHVKVLAGEYGLGDASHGQTKANEACRSAAQPCGACAHGGYGCAET